MTKTELEKLREEYNKKFTRKMHITGKSGEVVDTHHIPILGHTERFDWFAAQLERVENIGWSEGYKEGMGRKKAVDWHFVKGLIEISWKESQDMDKEWTPEDIFAILEEATNE